jgi:hypothetical protein
MLFKYIGCSLILLFSIWISREYKTFINDRVERTRAYLDFLRHVERKISISLLPQNKLCEGFSSPVLEKDFLPRFRQCGSLAKAYEGLSNGVGEAAGKIIFSYFSEFGKADLRGELLRVRDAVASLEPVLADEISAAEKSIKVFQAVAVAIAMGIIILLI